MDHLNGSTRWRAIILKAVKFACLLSLSPIAIRGLKGATLIESYATRFSISNISISYFPLSRRLLVILLLWLWVCPCLPIDQSISFSPFVCLRDRRTWGQTRVKLIKQVEIRRWIYLEDPWSQFDIHLLAWRLESIRFVSLLFCFRSLNFSPQAAWLSIGGHRWITQPAELRWARCAALCKLSRDKQREFGLIKVGESHRESSERMGEHLGAYRWRLSKPRKKFAAKKSHLVQCFGLNLHIQFVILVATWWRNKLTNIAFFEGFRNETFLVIIHLEEFQCWNHHATLRPV